jgi:glucosamine-6-phosphate deaminase
MNKLLSLLLILFISATSTLDNYNIVKPAHYANHALRPRSTAGYNFFQKQSSAGLSYPIDRLNRNLQAASFLRKKGAINPEIIEVLGVLEDHTDTKQFPDYLKQEIEDQEKQGVVFLVARLSNALATSYKGSHVYLGDILFNADRPAPHELIYMYIRHEAARHSSLRKEAEAVAREITAWNGFSEQQQSDIKSWADWYVENQIINEQGDLDTNIVKDSFYELAARMKQMPGDLSFIEHYVVARYGEIHLKKKHDIQNRLHYAAGVMVFALCFIPAFAGYADILPAITAFITATLLYVTTFRFAASLRIKHFANDISVADDYKGVKDGGAEEAYAYRKNLLRVVKAYKSNPSWTYALERKKIARLHFLSQIVQPQAFGKSTDRGLAPKGGMVRSPVRSNIATSMLVEHFLASSQDIFSEPAWVALIEEASLNEKAWFEKSTSVMDLAVRLPFCADKLISLLYKARNNDLSAYRIKDIDRFSDMLEKTIFTLAQNNKKFKCRAIITLCDMFETKKNDKVLFAMPLFMELGFYIADGSSFNQIAADITAREIQAIIDRNGHANIVLGAGDTITHPLHVNSIRIPSFAEQLAARSCDIRWNEDVDIWQLSEYAGIDSNHRSSHAHALKTTLFSKVFNDTEKNAHLINKNTDPQDFVEEQNQAGGIDLIVSGVGPDGHFGYNFPGATADPVLAGRLQKVALTPETVSANQTSYPGIVDNPFAWTLSLADIIQPLKGKKPKVIVLVLGKKRAAILRKSLEKPDSPVGKIMHELDVTIIVTSDAVRSLVPDYLERCSVAMRSLYGNERSKYYDLDIPMHMIDKHGYIVWVNKAWEEFIGFKEEQVIGMPVWFLLGRDQDASELRVKSKLSERLNNLPDITIAFRRLDQSTVTTNIREWQVTTQGSVVGIVTSLKPALSVENQLQNELVLEGSSLKAEKGSGITHDSHNPCESVVDINREVISNISRCA